MEGSTAADQRARVPEMTPGEKLERLLGELGVTKAQLGRDLDLPSGYQTVHGWTRDRGFDQFKRRAVCNALGLRHSFFDDDNMATPHAPPAGAPATPPREELLREHPRYPGWAEFLKVHAGLVESLDDDTLAAARRMEPAQEPDADAYLEIAIALRNLARRRSR